MKIFFVVGGNDGCGYYRAFLPAKYLNGLFTKTVCSIDWFDLPSGTPPPQKALKQLKAKLAFADKADIIVLQRPENPALLKEMAEKRWVKKFVYENDDLMWGLDKDNPMSLIPRNKEVTELLISGSHLVTTTTPWLARHYGKYNDNVTVLPNSIDFSLYPKITPQSSQEVRVLFNGSVTHLENMKKFMPVVRWMLKTYPNVKLVVQGLPGKHHLIAKRSQFPQAVDKLLHQYDTWDTLPQDRLEFTDFVPMLEYPRYTASLNIDFALIPRKDNDFNHGKSNVKYLELSALKIPVVAQSFKNNDSPYDYDIVDGETGFLAHSEETWQTNIDRLMDESTRHRIANNAFDYVHKYDIRTTVKRWKEAYEALLQLSS